MMMFNDNDDSQDDGAVEYDDEVQFGPARKLLIKMFAFDPLMSARKHASTNTLCVHASM